MTNKKLVYYTTTRMELWKNLTIASIDSLLAKGNFDGDIVILTDDSLDWGDFERENCRIIRCFDDTRYINIQRAFLPEYLDLSEYSHVLYMDADTLITGDINPFFQHDDAVVVCDELFTIESMGTNDHVNNGLFVNRAYDMVKHNKTINGGQFSVPRCQFDSFFQLYSSLSSIYNQYGGDQCALNFIVQLNLVKHVRNTPKILYYNARKEYCAFNTSAAQINDPAVDFDEYTSLLFTEDHCMVHFLDNNHTPDAYFECCKHIMGEAYTEKLISKISLPIDPYLSSLPRKKITLVEGAYYIYHVLMVSSDRFESKIDYMRFSEGVRDFPVARFRYTDGVMKYVEKTGHDEIQDDECLPCVLSEDSTCLTLRQYRKNSTLLPEAILYLLDDTRMVGRQHLAENLACLIPE